MMEQLIIAATGIPAIWLTNDERTAWRRFACLFGLAGQPFWIYATYIQGQWGMFVMALAFTAAWGRGFRNHWLRR